MLIIGKPERSGSQNPSYGGMTKMAEEEKEKEFTVTDRRKSSPGAGEEKPGSTEGPARKGAAAPEQKKEPSRDTERQTSANAEQAAEQGPLPEVDFSMFVMSLATTAQLNLGAIPNPETNESTRNLPAAKQMIDILAVLQEKTKGNLNGQEQSLLDNVLTSLRMLYVKAAEGTK